MNDSQYVLLNAGNGINIHHTAAFSDIDITMTSNALAHVCNLYVIGDWRRFKSRLIAEHHRIHCVWWRHQSGDNIVDRIFTLAEKRIPFSRPCTRPVKCPLLHWTEEYTNAVKKMNKAKDRMPRMNDHENRQAYRRLKSEASQLIKTPSKTMFTRTAIRWIARQNSESVEDLKYVGRSYSKHHLQRKCLLFQRGKGEAVCTTVRRRQFKYSSLARDCWSQDKLRTTASWRVARRGTATW